MRFLVHVDEGGTARLLKEVVQACVDDPATIAECDRVVLLTDAAEAGGLQGVVRRGDALVPLRVSSASFDFDAAQADATRGLPMVGSGPPSPGATLTAELDVPTRHPTHPYRHAYHRDHDGTCGCAPGDTTCEDLCAQRQGFDLERALELRFDAEDPRGPDRLDWQARRLEGCYAETLRGLHRLPLHAGGRFSLIRVSDVPTLGAQ